MLDLCFWGPRPVAELSGLLVGGPSPKFHYNVVWGVARLVWGCGAGAVDLGP